MTLVVCYLQAKDPETGEEDLMIGTAHEACGWDDAFDIARVMIEEHLGIDIGTFGTDEEFEAELYWGYSPPGEDRVTKAIQIIETD